MRTKRLPYLFLASSLVLAACGDSGTSSGDTGTLTLRLADAPGEEVESAVIWVSRVSIVGDAGIRIISSDTASYDLLALQHGVTAYLGSAEIPVGTYNQLRLIVDSARVTLKAPTTFTSGSSSAVMKVPSGSTSGLKVNLGNVSVVPGETVLLVDFDVSRSFVFQGPPGGPEVRHLQAGHPCDGHGRGRLHRRHGPARLEQGRTLCDPGHSTPSRQHPQTL